MLRQPSFSLAILAVAAALAASPVGADIYELKDGGKVVGKTLERSEAGTYVVQTPDGLKITLQRDMLQRLTTQDAAAEEYVARSRKIADTAEAHRELAEWCRQHKLLAEADHHLARVAELDPDDEEVRRSLGFQRVGNRWLSSDQLMAERGMVMYDGKYRTRQDVAIRERNKEQESVTIDWFAKLRLWRGWLDSRRPERAAEAHANIAAVNDPDAAPALVRIISGEPIDSDVFDLLLATLGRLDHPSSIQTLVAYTLDPAIPGDVRDTCLDFLISGDRTVSIIPYVQALKSKDNVVVNRAGYALGRIGNDAAISPLIDALVTTHKYQIQAESAGGGSPIGASFNPNGGGGGFSFGGGGPQIIEEDEQNERVLRALVKLSGKQNFEYDEQAWRAWFVDMQMRQRFNSRRDE